MKYFYLLFLISVSSFAITPTSGSQLGLDQNFESAEQVIIPCAYTGDQEGIFKKYNDIKKDPSKALQNLSNSFGSGTSEDILPTQSQ